MSYTDVETLISNTMNKINRTTNNNAETKEHIDMFTQFG